LAGSTNRWHNNALPTYSASLACAHPILVPQTLTTKNLHVAAPIGDHGAGELGRQLTHKTTWAGGQILLAPRLFISSKTCPGNGFMKPKLSLSERTYHCEARTLILARTRTPPRSSPPAASTNRGTYPTVTPGPRDLYPAGRSGGITRLARDGWVSGPGAKTSTPVTLVEAGTSQPFVALELNSPARGGMRQQ